MSQRVWDDTLRDFYLLAATEARVLELMSQGVSNTGITNTLPMATNTVRNHVANIYHKVLPRDGAGQVPVALDKRVTAVIMWRRYRAKAAVEISPHRSGMLL